MAPLIPIFLFKETFHLLVSRMEFIQEPKELGFTLEPPVVFIEFLYPVQYFLQSQVNKD